MVNFGMQFQIGEKSKEKIIPGTISRKNAAIEGKSNFFVSSKPNFLEEKLTTVLETGKGLVSNSIGYQQGLAEKRGEEKPYDYSVYEMIYSAVPMANAGTDLTIDSTVSKGLYVTAEDETVVEICEELMQRINFDIFLRQVVKHMLVYGDCFVEIVKDGTDISDLKILHPRTIKVKRDKFFTVKGFIQELGTGEKPIDFNVEEIAHFIYNQIGDRAYGTSMYEPLLACMRTKLQMERDMGFLLERKANAPYHVKMGTDEYPATQTDIDSFASELAALKSRNEWVTSHLVSIDVVGFQGKILDLKPFSEHFDNQLVYGLRVPYVLLGLGNIPEGLARVQQETYDRHIQSIQLTVRKVLESEIFKRLIEMKGKKEIPKLEWGKQTEEENQIKIEYYLKLLSAPLTNDTKTWVENQIRDLLGIHDKITDEERENDLQKNAQLEQQKNPKGEKDGDKKTAPKQSEKN